MDQLDIIGKHILDLLTCLCNGFMFLVFLNNYLNSDYHLTLKQKYWNTWKYGVLKATHE